ncbi:MAG: tryptophan synthase subunit beta [Spirochaetes bacterium]|nr:tryptophan synthase subunit beta [Spirochaetota bacterium]
MKGYFGEYGGRFVAETLINVLAELEDTYAAFRKDEAMKAELDYLYKFYAGRPTPVYYAKNMSQKYDIEIYLKREDLLHTGAHKLNNCLGQILLTKYMGKKRIIAETGAGQHGVATATVAALMDMDCTVYMGSVDVERQAPNVNRMKLLGTKVVPVEAGSRTLKDAVNAAMQDWVANCVDTHYLIGSVVGPHPFPLIVRDFQRIIGDEARSQMKDDYGIMPDFGIACVGGGSNAAGFFTGFADSDVKLIGIEAGGRSDKPGDHCMTLSNGRPGIFQGMLSYLLDTEEAQVAEVHSVSAGLDYPSVGPEHSNWKDSGRVEYNFCTDKQALDACLELSRSEGIIPALESSHAIGYLINNREKFKKKKVLINLSGRGDKDLGIIFKEAVI